MAKMFNYERGFDLRSNWEHASLLFECSTSARDMSPLYSTNSSSFSILLMKVSTLSYISLHIRTMHLRIPSIPVSGTYLARCYVGRVGIRCDIRVLSVSLRLSYLASTGGIL